MAEMKGLVKDTAIYGVSSILGRFLNWGLSPFYTYVLKDTVDFGIQSELYAWSALIMIMLTYGMETGFFRFANKHENKANIVYSTSLISLASTSILFIFLISIYLTPISGLLHYEGNKDFVWMMGFTVAIDAFCAIPFAWIRFKKRPIFFAGVRISMILTNIFFNIFFLLICPKLNSSHPEWISWFYRPDYGVGYIFLSNVFSTMFGLVLLASTFLRIRWHFEMDLFRSLLRYSLPLLLLGMTGIMNQSLDKMILKYLLGGGNYGLSELGIYTACFKLGIVMMMFTQAFRYAYEPFVFSRQKKANGTMAYVQAMKYFIIFSVFVLLGVMYYLDILKLLINHKYWIGLKVVPIVVVTYIFQGISFNLSFWYKLSDKTNWGAIISMIGFVITVAGNLIFVPMYGYIASAWTSFFCFLFMMILSWALGQKFEPIPYDMKSALKYLVLAILFYSIGMLMPIESLWVRLAFRTILLSSFVVFVVRQELPWRELPILNRFNRK